MSSVHEDKRRLAYAAILKGQLRSLMHGHRDHRSPASRGQPEPHAEHIAGLPHRLGFSKRRGLRLAPGGGGETLRS